jgi:hypothetical protein
VSWKLLSCLSSGLILNLIGFLTSGSSAITALLNFRLLFIYSSYKKH